MGLVTAYAGMAVDRSETDDGLVRLVGILKMMRGNNRHD